MNPCANFTAAQRNIFTRHRSCNSAYRLFRFMPLTSNVLLLPIRNRYIGVPQWENLCVILQTYRSLFKTVKRQGFTSSLYTSSIDCPLPEMGVILI